MQKGGPRHEVAEDPHQEVNLNKRITAMLVGAATFAAVAGFASTAYAFPTKTTACTSCHGGPDAQIAIKATPVSNTGTNATYNVSVTSPYGGVVGWTVLSGSTNIANATASTGSFTVADGQTYTLWSVDSLGAANSVTLSPVAPAPVPVPVPVPTPVPAPVPAPVPVPAPTVKSGPVTLHLTARHGRGLSRTIVVLENVLTHERFVAKTDRRGNVTFSSVPFGTYQVRVGSVRHGRAMGQITVGSDTSTRSFSMVSRMSRR